MIHIGTFDGDRNHLLPLFALADDAPAQIAQYLTTGVVLVARNDDDIVGHVQVVETDDARVCEIKSLAVPEAHQGTGIGTRLVHAAIACCVARSADSVIVSTATADIENLRFYQRCGFRMERIVRDAFGSHSGYADDAMVDGIPLRDQVYFRLDLR